MSNKILCVDDDANILAGFQRTLRKEFDIETALGGEQALAMINAESGYAVIVADMQMPGMNGLQFLAEAERLAPNSVRLMLTGNADQKTAMDAVNHGHVFRFLTKPCTAEDLALALAAGVKQYLLVTAERELLEKTLNGAIKVLTGILAMMDPASFGISEKVRDYMRDYALRARLPEAWALEMAAMLAQVGYVAIPAHVLANARSGLPLGAEEREMLTRVPRTGADLLAHLPRLAPVAKIVLYQAKHFSGAGFPPDAVTGDQIPHGARVLMVLRDLVELEAKGQTRHDALAQMRTRSGWYDPVVLADIVAKFHIAMPEIAATAGISWEVQLEELQSGDVLARDVATFDGTLLVPLRAR